MLANIKPLGMRLEATGERRKGLEGREDQSIAVTWSRVCHYSRFSPGSHA